MAMVSQNRVYKRVCEGILREPLDWAPCDTICFLRQFRFLLFHYFHLFRTSMHAYNGPGRVVGLLANWVTVYYYTSPLPPVSDIIRTTSCTHVLQSTWLFDAKALDMLGFQVVNDPSVEPYIVFLPLNSISYRTLSPLRSHKLYSLFIPIR